MNDAALILALRKTLEDHRMSRGEKKALRKLISGAHLDERRCAMLRAQAFDLAREQAVGSAPDAILMWLEEVMRLLLVPPVSDADARRQAGSEAWFSPGAEPLACIVRELRRVRARADICVFTITDDRISDGILSAARRGVRVRLISDDDKAGDRGSDVRRFLDAGIPTGMDRSEGHMHHKFALFDRARLLTGSFNWTRAASGDNHENLLVTGDAGLLASYEAEFERLWARYGTT